MRFAGLILSLSTMPIKRLTPGVVSAIIVAFSDESSSSLWVDPAYVSSQQAW